MPRILNLGSVNIDHVYHVPHFVRPGETLASTRYTRGPGGKGLNQSVALARAGATVLHSGRIGADAPWLLAWLRDNAIDTTRLLPADAPTGHALIQLTPAGENAILLHPGANHLVTPAQIARDLADLSPGDHFLCQNETSAVPDALRAARARGLVTWFNPAPFDPSLAATGFPLDCVDWLVLNETEGAGLSGHTAPDAILSALRRRLPRARLVLTLGRDGVLCADGDTLHRASPPPVRAVDTTAAGDTFIGYLAAAMMDGRPIPAALDRACRAAALSVTRPGAADSIPFARELPTE